MILAELDVPGDPIPKGRPRTTRTGHTYTPQRTVDAENDMAWYMKRACRRPTAAPVFVVISFRCATRRRCDVDNLAKLVLDAGNDVLWLDDQQVERLHIDVERGSENPGTSIRVELLHG